MSFFLHVTATRSSSPETTDVYKRQKLHHQPATVISNNTPPTVQQAAIQKVAPIDYTQYLTYSQNMISYALSHEGKDYKFYIPEKVLDCFNDCLLYTSRCV